MPHCWSFPQEDSGAKWLAFHYHHGDKKDDFVWVHLVGKGTIFLTQCLQSAVSELIRVRSKQPIRQPGEGGKRRKRALPIVKFYVGPSKQAKRK